MDDYNGKGPQDEYGVTDVDIRKNYQQDEKEHHEEYQHSHEHINANIDVPQDDIHDDPQEQYIYPIY